MNITFKSTMNKTWTLMDDRIVYGRKEILLSSIIEVRHVKHKVPNNDNYAVGSIMARYGDGAFELVGLHYSLKQIEDGEKAALYIIKRSSDEERKKQLEESEKFGDVDYYMQCDFCKYVFHYTIDDLIEDAKAQLEAGKQQLLGGINMVAGNAYMGQRDVHNAEEKSNRIVDRSKCPKCGNSKLNRLTEAEAKAELEKQSSPAQIVTATSSADELKKYKDLLDSGIITQEEFDAKKKQLLGL